MGSTLRRGFLSALLAALLPLTPARPDVVHLKNGTSIEGVVSPGSQPGHLKITVDKGLELEYPENEVLQVEQKKAPAQEFDERLRALAPGDVDGLLLLAEWARERKLRSREEEVYRRVLELDPNDPVARRALGYVVFANRWVREEELRGKRGLIQFRGEWVTPEEKERRLSEELRKEIADLLAGGDSENRYIREYSLRKLLEYKDPRARSIVLGFLPDPRDAVRAVSLQVLTRLLLAPEPPARPQPAPTGKPAGAGSRPSKKAENGGKAPARGETARKPEAASKARAAVGPTEDEVGRALLDRALNEESAVVRTSLANALQRLRHRRLFELAMEVLSTAPNALHRDRAAEAVLFALRKDWVEELFQALPRVPPGVDPAVGGNPQVRSLLARIFQEDLGYRPADWQAFWARNKHRYADE